MFKWLINRKQNKERERRREILYKASASGYEPEKEITLKVVILGDEKTAKTCFALRYVEDKFIDEYAPTMGAMFYVKNTTTPCGRATKVNVWDTAGGEKFASLTDMYLRGADGIIVAYDITSRASFEAAKARFSGLKSEHPDATFMVIGCKADLESQREVSQSDGKEFSREFGPELFYEVSPKTGANVNESMKMIVEEIFNSNGPSMQAMRERESVCV